MDAYKADDSEKPIVTVPAQDFRLPEVLRHIEAGEIVLVILTPRTNAKPKQDRP